MSEGLDQATQAFAEDLGGSAEIRTEPHQRSQERAPEDTNRVERLDSHPSQYEDVFEEPAGGDDQEDDEGDEETNSSGDRNGRDTPSRGRDGRFQSNVKNTKQQPDGDNSKRAMSLEEALEDPLDDDNSEERGNGDGGEDNTRQTVDLSKIDQNHLVEVKIDGKSHKVPLREALDGYVRQETFHRRLTDLDGHVKKVRSDRNEVDQNRAKYLNGLEQLQKQLDEITPKEPDWDQLYKNDPQGAPAVERQWNQYKRSREALRAETEATAAAQKQARDVAYAEWKQDHDRAFSAKHPEYQEPNKGSKLWERDRQGMVDTAKELGFSDEEIGNVVDSRYMEVLLMASKYARLQKRVIGLKPNKDDSNNSGDRSAERRSARPSNARRRLAQSGSTYDAQRVFEDELRREVS